MKEDVLKKFSYTFPAYSALYHCTEGLVFMRGGFAYKVKEIDADKNDRNMKINNEKRLKESLFKIIERMYNLRIDEYKLIFNHISQKEKDNFENEIPHPKGHGISWVI